MKKNPSETKTTYLILAADVGTSEPQKWSSHSDEPAPTTAKRASRQSENKPELGKPLLSERSTVSILRLNLSKKDAYMIVKASQPQHTFLAASWDDLSEFRPQTKIDRY